jgi:GNAT superfamily N-acetyltransferase
MDYARSGHRCAIERVLALAGLPGVSTRSGPYGLAVRSGTGSNDLNAVVGTRGFIPDSLLLTELQTWWSGAPASYVVEDPDEALTRALVDAGWIPERTGRWCGRPLDGTGLEEREVAAVALEAVADDPGLEQWLDVAADCGWIDDLDGRAVRRDLLRGAADDPRQALWVASLGGRPVGMARGWRSGHVVEVVDVAVRRAARRRGVGTALVSGVLVWGARHGAREVVAAPSPDGWRLFRALGFENVPVVPDVVFYWTGADRTVDGIVAG